MNENSYSASVVPPSSAMEDVARRTTRRRSWRLLSEGSITALFVMALGGLALTGHFTGWTLPKSSAIFGVERPPDDWCDEHSVPESICVECNEALLPRVNATYCRKHGVHYCPLERPEIAQLKQLPVITPEMVAMAQRGLDLKERPANNPKCTKPHRRIQFASIDAVDKMGVGVEPVWPGPKMEMERIFGSSAWRLE